MRAFQLILAAVLGTVSMAPALAQFAESVCDADAQLLILYPNQAAHDRLWQARLSPVLQTCAAAQARVDELRVERQLLDEEEGGLQGTSTTASDAAADRRQRCGSDGAAQGDRELRG